MIGVVVVTHGQLATELVNAAEMIVGDLPQFTAVSIGWHDDVNDAREEIAQAIERVRGDGRRAAADRHVRRHAVEPRHDVSREGPPRGHHRRQPADADQAGRPRAVVATCWRSPTRCATTAATPSGSRPTCCAARRAVRSDLAQSVTVVNQLGMHARAAAKFVHLATRFQAHVRVARDAREMDGKSIMGILLLAAARGTTITISADGADERDAVDGARARSSQSGFGEDACSA